MNPCTVEPSGSHAFRLGSYVTGPACIHCGLSYQQLASASAPPPAAPTPPAPRPAYYGVQPAPAPAPLSAFDYGKLAKQIAAVRMQVGEFGYPEMSPAFTFEEVKALAMEEKCPGAGFSSEGHQARKGTAELVDSGAVQVFCNKCRTKVVVFLERAPYASDGLPPY